MRSKLTSNASLLAIWTQKPRFSCQLAPSIQGSLTPACQSEFRRQVLVGNLIGWIVMPTSKRGFFTRMIAFVASIFATAPLPVHAGPAGSLPDSRQPVTAEANQAEINFADQSTNVADHGPILGNDVGQLTHDEVAAVNYYLPARLCSVARLNTPLLHGVRKTNRRTGLREKQMPKRSAQKQSAKRTIKVQPSWQRPSANRMARINARPSAVILNLPARNRSTTQTTSWSVAA